MQGWPFLKSMDLVFKCVDKGIHLHTWYIPVNMRKAKPLLHKSKDNNVNDLHLKAKITCI